MQTGYKKRKKLFVSTLFSGLSSLSDIAYFALLVLAGRIVGTEDFGIFNTGLAYASLVAYALNLGLDSVAIQKISSNEYEPRYLMGNILIWKTLLSTIVFTVFSIIIFTSSQDDTYLNVFLLLLLAAIFRSFNLTMRAFLRAHEKFKFEWYAVFFERLSILLLGLLSLLYSNSIVYLAASFVIVRLITLAIYLYIIEKYICRISWRINFQYILDIQRSAIPIGIAAIVFGVYLQMDVILLSLFVETSEVGIFSSAYKIFEGLLIISVVMTNVMYPRLSNYYINNKYKYKDFFLRSVKYMFIVGVPIAFIGIAYPGKIINLLFGSTYSDASNVIPFLFVSILLIFVVNSNSMNYRSTGNNKYVLYVMLSGLVAKLVSNLSLIPLLGIQGSAYANLFSAGMMLISSFVILKRNYPSLIDRGILVNFRVLLSAIIANIICWAVQLDNWIYSLALFAILYTAGLFLLKCLDKYELELISVK